MTHDHYTAEICKGLAAVGVNAIALITSTMEHIEYWLRISSLFCGIVVAILTAISIVRKQLK